MTARPLTATRRPRIIGYQSNLRTPAPLSSLLEGIRLLGHHVDDKAVGRVGRRGLAPAADQVGAQQHQQHQRQQADRQRADLHHGVGRARRDLPRGQHQPARRGGSR